jgi:eukaryotic-like serine/threonine-protein kinase
MNMPADRARIYHLFEAALDLPNEARSAFIRARCGDDDELARAVEELLALASEEAAKTAAFLECGNQPKARNAVGDVYGQFRLVELIGEGGMGVVYRAERLGGVEQTVAIKLLRFAVTAESAARFVREARLLARLEHPAIARLIDVGIHNGEPWIAMEFVPGIPIDQYCDSRGIDLRSRITLVALLAEAAATAHRMLVVHRDIKPTNVLVTPDGRPKLIDFGIAAALRSSSSESEPTADVRRLFTPHYAAPEQMAGEPATVATDVFGLGAVAYRLLTGQSPHSHSSGPLGYLLAATREDVEEPSRIAGRSARMPFDASKLRGDLDAILLKALARKPENRYASAVELRADLLAHLDGMPVSARQLTLTYRASRFVRRHLVGVSVAAGLTLALTAAAVSYAIQQRSVEAARVMAARRDDFLENLLTSPDPHTGQRGVTVAQFLDLAAAQLDTKLAGEPRIEASMLKVIAQTNLSLGRFQEGLSANERQLNLLREHGGSALELGQALTARAELLREQGKWNSADPVIRQAVDLLTPLQSTKDLCAALYLSAVIQMHTAHERDAEQTFRRVISLEEHGGAQLRFQEMYPYQGLAVLLADFGRYPEALDDARTAVQIAESWLAPDNPEILSLQVSYANSLIHVGKPLEAEPLLRETIEAETRVLGPEHKDTLLARLVYGEDLLELHRDHEADELLAATAALLESSLGSDNMYTLQARADEAQALCNDGLADQGLALLQRVDRARRQMLPASDRAVLANQVYIGMCLVRLGRYDTAEQTLKAAAAGLEAVRGPGYLRTQQAYRALAELYQLRDNPTAAQEWRSKIIL